MPRPRNLPHMPQGTPESVLYLKARALPAPQRGVVSVIPLELLPAYLEIHGLIPQRTKQPINAPALLVEKNKE